jgi:dTDP-4-dehydrorhamnose reductase
MEDGMKVLLTGAHGQLGWELQRMVPVGVTLMALGSGELDITDQACVARVVAAAQPQVVINAAAYTAVDRAETEPERALAVNGHGAGNLARAAREHGARLVHISTDFIFDGLQSTPYLPSDRPHPLGVYGQSKLAGEEQILAITEGSATTIIRTAWVYSAHGHNFVKTMLRLMAERETISVISDQVGTPTWAANLARAVWSVVETGGSGVHHCTDAGVASWYDFAMAIMEEAHGLGLLSRQPTILPIPSSAYPLPARRPAFSVLDKTSLCQATGLTPEHWRVALRKMLRGMKAGV